MHGPFQLGTMYWQNPNHSAAELDEDLRRIRDNGFSIVRAFIWWEQLERDEGRYDFAMHDRLFAAAERHGLRLMETFGLYLPMWLKQRLVAQGIEDTDRYWCTDRPEVREPMGRYIDAVVTRYAGARPLAMWNLWNEPTKPPCHCPHTRAAFLAWIRTRYRTLAELQAAWRGEHSVFDHLCPSSLEELDQHWLARAFRLGTRGRITPIEWDYLHFSTINLDDNLRWLRDRVRAIDPLHECHANPCSPTGNGLWNGLDEFRLGRTLDSISVSIHPSHFYPDCTTDLGDWPQLYAMAADKVRGWAGGKDAWVGELQAGTTFYHGEDNRYTPSPQDLSHGLWTALGRGLKGVLFWQWQSWRSSMMEVGEFGLRASATGAPTERSRAVEAVARILGAHAADFAQAARPPARAAILISRSENILKMLQWTGKRHLHGLDHEGAFAVYGCYRALHQANIAVDFLGEDEVAAGEAARYRVVFVPHAEAMGPAAAAGLAAFVAAGGHLWADGRCAFLDEHAYLRQQIPGHGLDAVFGCHEADFVVARGDAAMTRTDGVVLRGYRHEQHLEPTTGTVEARFANGMPAVVRNRFGAGIAELAGSHVTLGLRSAADQATMDHLAGFARAAGAVPVLDVSPGFEALLMEGPACDIMIVASRPGHQGRARISAPRSYVSVASPMGGAGFDGSTISREFAEFETAVFICRRS